jgi:mannose/cellobiose epimerase-like protein (N-acyl-D-glucosamine 2-epimerase family)
MDALSNSPNSLDLTADTKGAEIVLLGEFERIQQDLLVLTTIQGPVEVHSNVDTVVHRLEKPFCPVQAGQEGFGEIGTLDSWDNRALVRGIPCRQDGPECRKRVICGDLFLVSRRKSAPLFASPDFWVEYAATLTRWWIDHAIDSTHGGYYTNIPESGEVRDGPRETDKWDYIISRTIYGLSTAFALTGNPDYLNAARHGIDFLLRSGSCETSGALFFKNRMTREGDRHPDNPGQMNIFGQIYTLTGLAAYYDVACSPEVGRRIEQGLDNMVRVYRDSRWGGFYNAVAGENLRPLKDLTDGKSFNSIVDPLSAILYHLSNIGFQSQSMDIEGTIRELNELILDNFIDPGHSFIREVFTRDWQHEPPRWQNPYSSLFGTTDIGANLKTVWVLLRGLDFHGPAKREQARDAALALQANVAASGAWDAWGGGWLSVMNQRCARGKQGEIVGPRERVWWRQEEGIVADLLAFLLFRDPASLERALDGIRFYVTFLLDVRHGGVYHAVGPDGRPTDGSKGSWLKGAYHEIELARFLYVYLSVLLGRPVVLYSMPEDRPPAYEPARIPARIPGLIWRIAGRSTVSEHVVRTEYEYRWETDMILRGVR